MISFNWLYSVFVGYIKSSQNFQVILIMFERETVPHVILKTKNFAVTWTLKKLASSEA